MSVHAKRREEGSVGAEAEWSERSGIEREPRERGPRERAVPRAAHRAEVTILGAQVAALEAELRECDRRRQQLVQRYERLLDEAKDAERERDDGWNGGERASGRVSGGPADGGLRRRLARLFSR